MTVRNNLQSIRLERRRGKLKLNYNDLAYVLAVSRMWLVYGRRERVAQDP